MLDHFFMPQTINPRVHSTVTCAATDLVTVNLTGGDTENQVYIKNFGTGNVWISFDPATDASVAGVNCFQLKTGDTFTRNHVLRNTAFTMMSDAASTVVCLSFSPYP